MAATVQDLELMGRDWALVYRTMESEACLLCGAQTRLLVAFKPGRNLRICGTCRGY